LRADGVACEPRQLQMDGESVVPEWEDDDRGALDEDMEGTGREAQ